MPFQSYAALALPVAVSLAAVLIAFLGPRRKRSLARQLLTEAEGQMAFLLDGNRIEDATPEARALLSHRPGSKDDREALLQTLVPRFPTLREALDSIEGEGTARIMAVDGPERIEVEHWDGLTRLTLHAAGDAPTGSSLSNLAVTALEDELEMLRALGEDAPQLIWRQESDGTISWANRAYLDLEAVSAGRSADTPAPWPPKPLFEGLVAPADQGEKDERRLSVDLGATEPLWFDVTSIRRGAGSVHFAVDARASVKIAEAQRMFVQTLSRTFADLAIGLAIFDRQRRLVMFNPSLMELTRLPVEFLATKPPIQGFLDRLREQRMLPEPRNYRSWRQEIAALEAAAEDGTYCESWTLPGGETYRVTGRPHPDGAIALLIEDITYEMSLTRRFRGQIDTAHAVLDALEDAIAVFSAAGTMVMGNDAYQDLWHTVDDADSTTLREFRLKDEMTEWRDACLPAEIWGDIAAGAGRGGASSEIRADVRREDGRLMTVRAIPLQGGATMVRFSFPSMDTALLPGPQKAERAIAAG